MAAGRSVYSRSTVIDSRRTAPAPIRLLFDVDPALPGRQVIQRFVDAKEKSRGPAARALRCRLFHLDASREDPDSLALSAADYVRRGSFPPELRARADTLAAEVRQRRIAALRPDPEWLEVRLRALGVSLLFVPRCPVLGAPERRTTLNALGVDALVDLLDVTPARP